MTDDQSTRKSQMRKGAAFVLPIVIETDRLSAAVTLNANIRTVIEVDGKPDIIVLGPMWVTSPPSITRFIDEDGTEYQVIPT